MTARLIQLADREKAVKALAEAYESEAQLAEALKTERQRSGILLVTCLLLFLLSLVLMAILFL